MKTGLLILLVICATALAIPRIRRALPSEQVQPSEQTICASTTPCAWEIYHPVNKKKETAITNGYCTCAEDTVCERYEDDPSGIYVFRCLKPGTGLSEEHS